jgi:hypothetical protein
VLTTFILLLAAQATTPASTPSGVVQTTVSEPDVNTMSPQEIKAFNATVPSKHPYHIRCTREVDVGSLIRGATTCKTNKQWSRAEQIGNEGVREMSDRMTSKAENGN